MRTKLSLILTSVALATVFISCGNNTETPKAMPHESNSNQGLDVTPSQLAIAKDPVCGMNMANQKIADTAVYNGGIYAFCSDDCKEVFKKDPEKYAVKK